MSITEVKNNITRCRANSRILYLRVYFGKYLIIKLLSSCISSTGINLKFCRKYIMTRREKTGKRYINSLLNTNLTFRFVRKTFVFAAYLKYNRHLRLILFSRVPRIFLIFCYVTKENRNSS